MPNQELGTLFGLSTNHASTRSRGLFLIAYRVSLRTSMSKWESVVYGAFLIYLCAQVRAGNSRLDYPPNHASTRSRGLFIIAHRVSLRTSMSKWWFAFLWAFFEPDLGRSAPSLRGAGLPKAVSNLTSLYRSCYTRPRILCLDYIETIATPLIFSLYPVRFPSICITT
jgi:hypothetical protein